MKVFQIDISMKNELLDLYRVLSTFPEVKETLKNLKYYLSHGDVCRGSKNL